MNGNSIKIKATLHYSLQRLPILQYLHDIVPILN